MEHTAVHANKKIGEWLLHLGLLTKRQLDLAVEAQAANPALRVGEILIQKGYITQQELDETLAVQEVLKGRTPLKDYPFSPKILSLLPEHFALQHEVLPLAQIAMRLLVAAANGRNFEAIDKITLHTGLIVVSIEVPREELLAALGKIYNRDLLASEPPPPPPAPVMMTEAITAVARPEPVAAPGPRAAGESANEAAIANLIGSVVDEALQLNASEIHLTPYEAMLEVRCRTDGVMRKLLEIPKKFEGLVIKRLLQLASMSAMDRGSQVDRLIIPVNGVNVTFSMASAPTIWGDRYKLTVLRTEAEIKTLGMLGMEPEQLLDYKQLLRGVNGVVLIVGPRGNGKSTTLRSTLAYLDKLTHHIVSIEDQVLRPLAGVTHLQLPPRSQAGQGQDQALLQAIDLALAQSPDILVVDRVTNALQARAVLDASLKGLLVLTTMDAPSASAALAELLAMSLPPYLLGVGLAGVVCQRLVRRNCTHCATEYPASFQERRFLGMGMNAPVSLVRGVGCEQCHQTGYLGQVGIFELLRMTSPLAELVVAPSFSCGAVDAQVREKHGSLLDSAKQKISAGDTSIFEASRVLGDAMVLGEELF